MISSSESGNVEISHDFRCVKHHSGRSVLLKTAGKPDAGWLTCEKIVTSILQEGREGGVVIPFLRKLFFQIPAQISQSQPGVLKLKSHSHFSIVFFMNPSPSAQNPISQPRKQANPSSYFTPSRPSCKSGQVAGIAFLSLLSLALKQNHQTASSPFWFVCLLFHPISELIHLAGCVKFNP